MTTINIERRLLERLYLYWLEDADPRELDEFTAQVRAALSATAPVLTDLHDIKEAVKAVLAAPASAPEPVAWMSPKRFYRTRAMALINGEQLIEPLYLYPPATAPEPSWHDAPTVPGLWVSDFSWMAQKLDRDTVEFYAQNRSIPSRRWYGPIPEETP
jgi:hypothetical protein